MPTRVMSGPLQADSQQGSRSMWRDVLSVAGKDWRSEWRTRAALNAAGLFALAAPITLGYVVAEQRLPPEALGGLLWTVLFFAAMVGLPRTFVKEEESGTAELLRLHLPAQAVLWGKTLGQVALLCITQLGAVPVFVLLLGARIAAPGVLLASLLLGDAGLALASCLLGAMAAQTRTRGTLFCALAAPLMLPLLVCAAQSSGVGFGAQTNAAAPLQAMLGFDVALLSAVWMLWEFVWSS